jgi:hypothetical protein
MSTRQVYTLTLPGDEGEYLVVARNGAFERCHYQRWSDAYESYHRELNSSVNDMIEDILYFASSWNVSILVKLGLISPEHPIAIRELA